MAGIHFSCHVVSWWIKIKKNILLPETNSVLFKLKKFFKIVIMSVHGIFHELVIFDFQWFLRYINLVALTLHIQMFQQFCQDSRDLKIEISWPFETKQPVYQPLCECVYNQVAGYTAQNHGQHGLRVGDIYSSEGQGSKGYGLIELIGTRWLGIHSHTM